MMAVMQFSNVKSVFQIKLQSGNANSRQQY